MKRAERALNLALDGAPTNDEALAELVKFYRDAGDMTSVRVHLNRVAGTMRARVARRNPKDGVAYRVISRAMARARRAGVDGSIPIARAAAELAQLLGAARRARAACCSPSRRASISRRCSAPRPTRCCSRARVQTELRQIFTLLGDRVAKHVGVDLRPYGVAPRRSPAREGLDGRRRTRRTSRPASASARSTSTSRRASPTRWSPSRPARCRS